MTKVNYVRIYGYRDRGKFCIEGKVVRYGWSGSEQASLTEVKKEEFEVNLTNSY